MKYKKIVIKIGTSVLAKEDGSIDESIIRGIASQVTRLLDKDVKVIIVSSGAICAGRKILKVSSDSLADLQAMASVGQNELMRLYSEAFGKRSVGQILLTQEDFDDRQRYLNIKYTLEALISANAVPIVNENDTVSTDEIKCGDNDRIAALLADLAEADSLMLLTDVDGLCDRKGQVVGCVREITDDIKKLAGKERRAHTKGGMATKIEAADRVVNSGIDCFIANGKRKNIISEIMDSRFRGDDKEKSAFTYFKAKAVTETAKKRWIAYSSKVKGKIIVDDGARNALTAKHKSLLSAGITGKEGSFKPGDAVGIADSKGKEFARGLTNYSSEEIARIKGLKTSDIESVLGYKDHDEVVHRDNLVLLRENATIRN